MRAPLLLACLGMSLIGCADRAEARCFAADTLLPTRAEAMSAPGLGASAHALIEALFDRDAAKARTLLGADPQLARLAVGREQDMLTLAVASCDPVLVAMLLDHGAPVDGHRPGLPLDLALRADAPDMAYRLLKAGANPNPQGAPPGPLRTAIELNALPAVRMLLDFHADANVAERTGRRPLHIALDMEHFRIAELLLERGADPWATDSSGANLGSAVTQPMVTRAPDEAAAQQRLRARLNAIGWPSPPPAPRAVRVLVQQGRWPPR